jgi:hypothetical protein
MTIFIFNEYCDLETQTFPIVLQELQQLKCLSLSIHEILKYHQNGHEIWLVLPVKMCSIHQVELPKLSRKDVIPAIESILEDCLPQDFQDLHCFFHGPMGKPGIFQVAVIEKKRLSQIQEQWSSLGVIPAGITLDWYALKDNQVLLLPGGDAIANTDAFKGWVSKSLVEAKLIQMPLSSIFYSLVPCVYNIQFNPIREQMNQWVVEQILLNNGLYDIRMTSRRIPMLEGISNAQIKDVFLRFAVGFALFTVILDIGFLINNFIHYRHQKYILQSYTEVATDSLEQKISIYRRHLAQKNKFWLVFNGLQHAMMSGINIKHFDYSQEHLKVRVTALEMPLLQNFKHRLQQAHLNVQESQVQVQQDGIQANLEIRAR